MTALLEATDLVVKLPVEGSRRAVLRGVSLTIGVGEAVGLVGESGSGKSMTARTVARLLPRGAEVSGSVNFDGRDPLALRGSELRQYRGEVAMIFQDPRAHINPVRTIGDFMTEALCTNGGVARDEARRRAIDSLQDVGIGDGERRLSQYPHELSGGLLQRVMIASALLTEPRLLLADEPTTALDVTTQAEVMAIIDELRRDRGMAMLFITHDLDLADAICDRTYVMYAGEIVEEQGSNEVEYRAAHPYTRSLQAARPLISGPPQKLAAIPGRPVSAYEAPAGCAFAPRCGLVQERCRTEAPEFAAIGSGGARCWRAAEVIAGTAERTGTNG